MSTRPKKNFPPGTFIPTFQRLMAICQLCLAFSLMLWYMTQPFMGEYFTLRSRMLLYEYIMGQSDILKSRPHQEAKSERQAQRFKQLSPTEQQVLKKDYQQIQHYAKRPALKKIIDGIQMLTRDIPPFEQAWIFFSITIAILILLKVEGAKQAAWILPFIVIAYILENQWTGKSPYLPPDHSLFPTEQILLQNYLHESLGTTTLDQKKQLEKGWRLYLIKNWSSHIKELNVDQLEEAEFNFTRARLALLRTQPLSIWLHTFHEKLTSLSLLFYLFWNCLFAWIVSRSKTIQLSSIISILTAPKHLGLYLN